MRGVRAVAQAALRHQVRFRTEGTLQQAVTVQGLDPMAVEHVTLPSGNAPQRARTDQAALKALRFDHLEERYPIDTHAFYRHRPDVVSLELGGDIPQVGGVIAKGAHQLDVLVTGNADHDFVRTDVHSRGMWIDPAHRSKEARFGQAGVGLAEFAHRLPPAIDWAGLAASVE